MPTWSGILSELQQAQSQKGVSPFDHVRRKYLVKAYEATHNNIILYASRWTELPPNVSPEAFTISDEDIQGLMEVVHGLSGPNLDLILHSPGGSAEAAEAFVTYLRSKFDRIRVIVPQVAMSAATMVACAADVIVLGKHSFLGPTDPQIMIGMPSGVRTTVPAQAILEQFEQAKKECKDPTKMGAWLPMLGQYGPALLVQCKHALEMSQRLVESWLKNYMFKKDPEKDKKAREIAAWLSDHGEFKSHGRHIPRSEVERRGLCVEYLEKDQQIQDLFLSVFHATTHTFGGTPAIKIIENHLGRAYIRQAQPVFVQVPPGLPRPPAHGDPPKPA